jgi:ribosomal-protein-alanine N-acetyltransferase
MQGIKIRKVHQRDLATVYEVERLSFEDPYPPVFIDYLHHCNSKTFLVAERDGEICGYVIATTQTDIGHIVSIAVIPSERRKGFGRGLITAVLNVLRNMGMNSVRLEVRRSNVNAQRFYEALSFKYAHTVRGYYRSEDALVYFKFL